MAIIGDIDISKWLGTMYQDYTTGRERKETMFGKGVGALESYADIFRSGGEYGAGVEAMIGRGEKKAVASGYQNLVSAGLANTTMPMHLQQTYQEEIGMPTRLRAEDVRMERLGGALGSLGQMYAGYQPGTATAGDIAHMATGGFGMLQQGRIADMQAQLQAYNQDPYPFGRFEDQFSRGGTSGGGTTGGGITAPTTLQHRGGFTNPYGGGGYGGGGGFAEGELPVMMGGQRVIPGTEIPFGKNVSRNAASGIESELLAAGYKYDPSRGTYVAPTGGGGSGEDFFAPSTPIEDPFADYAARVSGISAYI